MSRFCELSLRLLLGDSVGTLHSKTEMLTYMRLGKGPVDAKSVG